MSLSGAGFTLISSKERFEYEDHEGQVKRQLLADEAKTKKQEQLVASLKTTVTVCYPEKINGTYYYQITVTCVFPDEAQSQRTWQIKRHYTQFLTLFENICYINKIESWFNFPGRAFFNTDSVLEERLVAFQKLAEIIVADKAFYLHPMVLKFFNPYEAFEIHS